MGFSINGFTPTWMVYFMENPIEIGDLGASLFEDTQQFLEVCSSI